MKSLKKIKVLEEGRLCISKEMKKLYGGCSSFTGCNKYGFCGLLGYTTCQKAETAAYGYENDGSTITCGSGYYYSSNEDEPATTCAANKAYKS